MSNITIQTLESKIVVLQKKLSDAKRKEAETQKKNENRRIQIIGKSVVRAIEEGILEQSEIKQIVEMYATGRDSEFALQK